MECKVDQDTLACNTHCMIMGGTGHSKAGWGNVKLIRNTLACNTHCVILGGTGHSEAGAGMSSAGSPFL